MEYTVNHYPEKNRFEVVEDGRAWDCGDSC